MSRSNSESDIQRPSGALARALEQDGLPSDIVASLAVVQARGSYAGRRVTYLRVFSPERATEQGVQVHSYADLEDDRALVLRSGYVERDGTIVLTWRAPSLDAKVPGRTPADRSLHADDERFVFPLEYQRPPEVRP